MEDMAVLGHCHAKDIIASWLNKKRSHLQTWPFSEVLHVRNVGMVSILPSGRPNSLYNEYILSRSDLKALIK